MNPLRFASVVIGTAIFALSTMTCAAMDPAAPSPAPKLQSGVFAWDQIAGKPTDVGYRRDVFDAPTVTAEKFECHVTTLNPGRSPHAPHRHPQEEFMIVKEGTLEVSLNGASRTVGPGSLLYFGSNDLHSVRNIGERPATYLVFNIVTAATHTVGEKRASECATSGMLASAIFDWNDLKPMPIDVGFRRALVEKSTMTCGTFEGHVTTLNAGSTSHSAHHHPDEEIVVMKEGVLDVTINGKTERMGPGALCFFSSNDEHGVVTVGTEPATYFAIRFTTAATPKQ